MEIRKGDFQCVKWDDSIKFLRVVKNKKQHKFNVHAFTTAFHKELVEKNSASAFFVYYGLAGLCAVAIVLGVFEFTEKTLNWTESLLPYLGVGSLAILSSFLLSRLVIKFVSFILNLIVHKSKKKVVASNSKRAVDFIKINRPERTPFPEELDQKMA
ncbi:MAG: hypothetical protein LBF82_02535 [Lactobacillales bacterium]|jgi:hypothetical protein|nr:hypothetical protein [Lactobacillales bacterium]